MKKTVYLALGLMLTGHAFAATMTGSIGVKLVIYSECSIDGQHSSTRSNIRIPCEKKPQAQPKITQSALSSDAKTRREDRLVTIEW